jgi:multidrug resistance efflux pump
MNMGWIIVCLVAVSAAGRPAAAEGTALATASDAGVVVAEEADLAPQEVGTIKDVKVDYGQMVEENKVLVQLDDSKAQSELDVAQAKWESARIKSEAAKINVEYAQAANDVAKADYKVNQQANRDYPNAIPQVTMNEKSLKCEETRLSIMKAQADQRVAEEEQKVAEAEVAAAKVMVQRHKVVSPIAGMVVDLHNKHKGEAAQPAEAVVRVVRLDSLWVQGKVSAAEYARAQLEGQEAKVRIAITGSSAPQEFSGRVIFVSPLTDTQGKYLVRAKVENRKAGESWLLFPGMRPVMEIQVRPLPKEAGAR